MPFLDPAAQCSMNHTVCPGGKRLKNGAEGMFRVSVALKRKISRKMARKFNSELLRVEGRLNGSRLLTQKGMGASGSPTRRRLPIDN